MYACEVHVTWGVSLVTVNIQEQSVSSFSFNRHDMIWIQIPVGIM